MYIKNQYQINTLKVRENVAGSKPEFLFPFNFNIFPHLISNNDSGVMLRFSFKPDIVSNGMHIFSPVEGKVTLYKVTPQDITEEWFKKLGVLSMAQEVLTGPNQFDHEDTLLIEGNNGLAAIFQGILGVDKAKNKQSFNQGEIIGQIQSNVVGGEPSNFKFGLLKKNAQGVYDSLKQSEIDFVYRDSKTGQNKRLEDAAVGFGAGALLVLLGVLYFSGKDKK